MAAMTPLDHHRKAHAALDRAHVYLDIRLQYVATSTMRSPYHAWIDHMCHCMGTGALAVTMNHDRQANALLGGHDRRRITMD